MDIHEVASNSDQVRCHSEPLARTREHRELGHQEGQEACGPRVRIRLVSSSDPRLDVLEACAVLHLQVCNVVEPAESEDASQAAHMDLETGVALRFSAHGNKTHKICTPFSMGPV